MAADPIKDLGESPAIGVTPSGSFLVVRDSDDESATEVTQAQLRREQEKKS